MAFVLNRAYEKATWVLKEESMEEPLNALSENESNELVKAALCHINELKLQ